jgi:predicted ArsR family transcriptional regulator
MLDEKFAELAALHPRPYRRAPNRPTEERTQRMLDMVRTDPVALSDIAEALEVTEQTVRNMIKALVGRGYTVEKTGMRPVKYQIKAPV